MYLLIATSGLKFVYECRGNSKIEPGNAEPDICSPTKAPNKNHSQLVGVDLEAIANPALPQEAIVADTDCSTAVMERKTNVTDVIREPEISLSPRENMDRVVNMDVDQSAAHNIVFNIDTADVAVVASRGESYEIILSDDTRAFSMGHSVEQEITLRDTESLKVGEEYLKKEMEPLRQDYIEHELVKVAVAPSDELIEKAEKDAFTNMQTLDPDTFFEPSQAEVETLPAQSSKHGNLNVDNLNDSIPQSQQLMDFDCLDFGGAVALQPTDHTLFVREDEKVESSNGSGDRNAASMILWDALKMTGRVETLSVDNEAIEDLFSFQIATNIPAAPAIIPAGSIISRRETLDDIMLNDHIIESQSSIEGESHQKTAKDIIEEPWDPTQNPNDDIQDASGKSTQSRVAQIKELFPAIHERDSTFADTCEFALATCPIRGPSFLEASEYEYSNLKIDDIEESSQLDIFSKFAGEEGSKNDKIFNVTNDDSNLLNTSRLAFGASTGQSSGQSEVHINVIGGNVEPVSASTGTLTTTKVSAAPILADHVKQCIDVKPNVELATIIQKKVQFANADVAILTNPTFTVPNNSGFLNIHTNESFNVSERAMELAIEVVNEGSSTRHMRLKSKSLFAPKSLRDLAVASSYKAPGLRNQKQEKFRPANAFIEATAKQALTYSSLEAGGSSVDQTISDDDFHDQYQTANTDHVIAPEQHLNIIGEINFLSKGPQVDRGDHEMACDESDLDELFLVTHEAEMQPKVEVYHEQQEEKATESVIQSSTAHNKTDIASTMLLSSEQPSSYVNEKAFPDVQDLPVAGAIVTSSSFLGSPRKREQDDMELVNKKARLSVLDTESEEARTCFGKAELGKVQSQATEQAGDSNHLQTEPVEFILPNSEQWESAHGSCVAEEIVQVNAYACLEVYGDHTTEPMNLALSAELHDDNQSASPSIDVLLDNKVCRVQDAGSVACVSLEAESSWMVMDEAPSAEPSNTSFCDHIEESAESMPSFDEKPSLKGGNNDAKPAPPDLLMNINITPENTVLESAEALRKEDLIQVTESLKQSEGIIDIAQYGDSMSVVDARLDDDVENVLKLPLETEDQVSSYLKPISGSTELSTEYAHASNQNTCMLPPVSEGQSRHFDDTFGESVRSDQTSFGGFRTGSNKPMPISERAISRMKEKYLDEMEDFLNPGSNSINQATFPPMVGFLSARGNAVPISKESMSRATALCEDVGIKQDLQIYEPPLSNGSKTPFTGFVTGSNKVVPLSEKSLAKAKALYGDDATNNDKPFLGGASPEPRVENWLRDNVAAKLSDTLANTKALPIGDTENKQGFVGQAHKTPSMSGFVTGRNQSVPTSDAARARAEAMFKDLDFTTPKKNPDCVIPEKRQSPVASAASNAFQTPTSSRRFELKTPSEKVRMPYSDLQLNMPNTSLSANKHSRTPAPRSNRKTFKPPSRISTPASLQMESKVVKEAATKNILKHVDFQFPGILVLSAGNLRTNHIDRYTEKNFSKTKVS
jgi:hypothetical protein